MITDGLVIHKASPDDAPALLSLILALAAYEKLDPPDAAAQKRLVHDLSGPRPRYEAYLAELDGRPVGYTFVFETYSSFLALPTLYLEDFFVLPECRGRKIGFALFRAMVAEAHRRGCGRMEWAVLDWNRLAIDFYERAGARQLEEWKYYRLTVPDMERILGDRVRR
jgi:GNAT superfamily N-acetyltransferase